MTLAIETIGLAKSYRVGRSLFSKAPPQMVRALYDVDLSILPGEIFGIVGRNGYGKTTLTKCLSSLLLPTKGTARIFGQDIETQNRALRGLIGWVGTEERSFYYRLTGAQNLRFFAELQGLSEDVFLERMHRLSEMVGVSELLDRRFHEYSTGNRHRLAIVRALLHDPKLLLLDEPTRSLDPFAAQRLRESLRAWISEGRDRTIVITSHNLDEVEGLCSKIAVMHRGTVGAIGTLAELRERHGEEERVGLCLNEAVEVTDLNLGFPATSELDRRGDTWARFSHRPGDGRLPSFLDVLRERGIKVLSVDREQLGLQDVIDRVDGGEDG